MKIVCPQCGFAREVTPEKLPKGHAVAKCPKCDCRFRFSALEGAGEILPPKGWQRMEAEQEQEEDIRVLASNAYAREARRFEEEQARAGAVQDASRNPWAQAPVPDGWLAAFYQTVIRVMFQAQVFFAKLTPVVQMSRPLLFFIIICVFQTLADSAWVHIFYSVFASYAEQDQQLTKLLALLAPNGSLFFTLLLRAGSFVFQLYIFSFLMYLVYRIVANDRVTFSLVFQVLAYSSAPWLLSVVPVVGSLAGTFWGIGCAAVGCKAAMRLSWGQTLAGFLPIAFMLAPILPQLSALISK